MKHSKLTWEEFDTYDKVGSPAPYDFRVHDGKYYTFEELGIASVRRVFEIDAEDFDAYLKGKRTAEEIDYKAENGTWPSTEEERKASLKKYVIDTPTALIADPTSLSLFSKEELTELIPIAEQQWIDWKGKLPDDYVSPLEK